MKKIVCVLVSLFLLSTSIVGFAENENPNYEGDTYISMLSDMIEEYSTDDYFSTMSVTIGDTNLVIDGEERPIDESGSVAYVENGRTMMPVRGIAEAIGAEVSYDDLTQTVTVEKEETTVAMTIGDAEMEVNGEIVTLLNAPEIKDDRTMLPVRDVAEALDCEVTWEQETETAKFTRPYQTKRIVVNSEDADRTGAVAAFSAEGKTVIQFDSIDDAKECVEINTQNGYIAEPDYVRNLSAMSWGVNEIGSQNYYSQIDYAAGSAVVAVIDTGIDFSHSFFNGRIVNGYDIYNNDSNPQDGEGHGTHVASTVIDVAGFNPNIKVMPVKVFPDYDDYTYSTTIASAIEYAVNKGANVINLSLGGTGAAWIEQAAVNKAYDNNVAVIAAAGNEGLNLDIHGEYVPASLDHVITVSAMNKDGSLAFFSNYGASKLEFTAPGVDIKGAKLGGGYCHLDGTSMAAPHVAGAYAIVKAAHPEKTVDEITDALRKNAINKGNSGYFGYGLINVDFAERYLSSAWVGGPSAEDVSGNSATIKGRINFDGIKPEAVGVRVGTSKNNQKEVYKVRYNGGGGGMDFSCKVDSLKPGKKYYGYIFVTQGGLEYASDDIVFTTSENDPEPEPDESELRIIPRDYPTGDIKEGSAFGLSGRIKSNYHITDVRSYILDSNKKVVQESSGWTTTQTYVIENSKLDTGLKFNKLSPGKYYLKYYAEDESGNAVSWVSDSFRIIGQEKAPEPEPSPTPSPDPTPAPAVSELRILPDAYPSGQLNQGSKFGLSGRIKSNYHITDVRAYMLDANKNVVMEASGWTTTQTYVIENSALDKGMKFNNLSPGTYYLKYYAADESGNSVSWVSNAFSVVGNTTASQLRILPDKYPSGTITKGRSFGLSGRIKSDRHITDVRAYMLDANKNVVMEASGWTTTQTYVIEGSALDKGMKFNNLSEGGYYLKYYAADESGNSVSWTSDMFYVR